MRLVEEWVKDWTLVVCEAEQEYLWRVDWKLGGRVEEWDVV